MPARGGRLRELPSWDRVDFNLPGPGQGKMVLDKHDRERRRYPLSSWTSVEMHSKAIPVSDALDGARHQGFSSPQFAIQHR